MDKAVKKDITRRYKAMTEAQGTMEDNTGQTDTFLCQQCGHPTRTVVKDKGVILMGIECPYCHGEAMHQDEDNKKIPVTQEWKRPTLDEVLQMAEENRMFSVTMILNGVLVRCSKN